MSKPICFTLVGVPGSGKSTWANLLNAQNGYVHVSTDAWVEREAERVGKTYSEIFNEYMPKAVEMMTIQVVNAREKGLSIIWDQTSTTSISRAKKFNMLQDYKHIAVVLETPPLSVLNERLASRPGKIIPPDVVCKMIENLEYPTKDEGYDSIWYIR
jgi:adenylate kinase family enzyme